MTASFGALDGDGVDSVAPARARRSVYRCHAWPEETLPRIVGDGLSLETGFRWTPKASVRHLAVFCRREPQVRITSLTPSSEESRLVTPAGPPAS